MLVNYLTSRGSWINPVKLQSQAQMINFLKIMWPGDTRDVPQTTRNKLFSLSAPK